MKNNLYKKSLTILLSSTLILPNLEASTGVGSVVFDPSSYAAILESIEKYNSMIKNMQDTLDTMNRINDVMNTASNQLDNLQTGLADPTKLVDRFQSNLNNIENNFNRIQKNLKQKKWKDAIIQSQFASCQKKWQNLRAKYPDKYIDSPLARELEANMRWIESVNNDGLEKANKSIHDFFDGVIDKMDITNIESKISDSKNATQTIVDICNTVNKEEFKATIDDCTNDYHKAVKEQNAEKANKAIKCIREKRYELRTFIADAKNKEIKVITTKLEKSNYDTSSLTINQKNCKLEGDWKKVFGNINEDELIERKTIKNGKEICIAKQDTINRLKKQQKTNDAIILQNDRNMGLALAGDSYSIQQAQLETMQMISSQILVLNDSINAIGQIAKMFIYKDIEYEEEMNEYIKPDDDVQMQNLTDSLKNYKPSYEYNKFGLPVRKSSRE